MKVLTVWGVDGSILTRININLVGENIISNFRIPIYTPVLGVSLIEPEPPKEEEGETPLLLQSGA